MCRLSGTFIILANDVRIVSVPFASPLLKIYIRKTVCHQPHSMSLTSLGKCATCTGSDRLTLSPVPNCPNAFQPHVYAFPSSVSAAQCLDPLLTCKMTITQQCKRPRYPCNSAANLHLYSNGSMINRTFMTWASASICDSTSLGVLQPG